MEPSEHSRQNRRSPCRSFGGQDTGSTEASLCALDPHAVRVVIRQQFQIDLPIRTTGEYSSDGVLLPRNRSSGPMSKTRKRLRSGLKPRIRYCHPRETGTCRNTLGDETASKATHTTQRVFSQGKAPVVRLNAKKSTINMISAISNSDKARFMLYRETMTGTVLIKFMSRLVKDADERCSSFLTISGCITEKRSPSGSKQTGKKSRSSSSLPMPGV